MRIRGVSTARTARARDAGRIDVGPREEKEVLRHTVRLTIGGAHSQVGSVMWEMTHPRVTLPQTASPNAAITSALRG
jgi:hypothetical protein